MAKRKRRWRWPRKKVWHKRGRPRKRTGKSNIDTRKIGRLLITLTLCWGIWNTLAFMYTNMYGVVMDFAAHQTVNIATAAISEGVRRSELSRENPSSFITISDGGNLPIVNNMLINYYLANISREIVDIMQYIQRGDLTQLGLQSLVEADGVLFEVPWAAAFNLTLFHNFGPVFPVRARMLGNVGTDMEIQIKEYGINNAVLSVDLIIDTNIQVALPFRSHVEPVTTRIPLVTTPIQGEVPQFYWNSSGGDPAAMPPVVIP